MALIDPRLRTAIPNYWPSKCTVRTKTYSSSSGQKVVTGYVDVAGVVNIECRLAPLILLRPTNTTTLGNKVTSSNDTLHCLLNLYTMVIEPEVMIAVVNGVQFEIRGVEYDSERFLTRLRLEEITP